MTSPAPEDFSADIRSVFEQHLRLRDLCGELVRAEPQDGLTNRVFRLETQRGAFFLRLPHAENPAGIDRAVEARNISRAAELKLALRPLFCHAGSGILLTQAVETHEPSRAALPERLGRALAKLHLSDTAFDGELVPGNVYRDLRNGLVLPVEFHNDLSADLGALDQLMARSGLRSGGAEAAASVPSHCDLSPGNCLPTRDGLWLIDWEYSGMSDPAWDIAYAIVEHDFTAERESRFLDAYSRHGAAGLRPAPAALEAMKVRCDAISALWGLAQAAAGRDQGSFHGFARERTERALRRAAALS